MAIFLCAVIASADTHMGINSTATSVATGSPRF